MVLTKLLSQPLRHLHKPSSKTIVIDLGKRAWKSHLHKPSSKTIVIDLGKRAWKSACFESSLFIIHECQWLHDWEEPCSTDLPILLLTELSAANHVEDSAGLIMVTSRVTRITLVTRYLIGRFNLRTSWTRVLHATFQNNKLKKGRWSWISNCSEAFHTDSWMAEANPGHSDRDAILQALLPGPRYGSTLGPGKARMPLRQNVLFSLYCHYRYRFTNWRIRCERGGRNVHFLSINWLAFARHVVLFWLNSACFEVGLIRTVIGNVTGSQRAA